MASLLTQGPNRMLNCPQKPLTFGRSLEITYPYVTERSLILG